ncbi:hypothetical protein [Variovorax sp. UMC13]|uniref:hypothetical protein n=1 Tax=Variovorax sp. UMC13 TaxID=1862326 RepID=UPI001C81F1BA|nr:hypothetical protein [Variovorax sp. UMC13]MBB1604819.1 hypothetical protein [Variovorax sp. UMC13]
MATYSEPPLAAQLQDAASIEGSRQTSGVSWGAIFAGAAGAASLSLVLLLLGTGLGFSSVSPWTNQGASAASIGIAAILWLSFTQIAASGMGGYLAGRLRTKWAGIHTDEVYFRDTAHGFLAWSVATLLTAALLTSVVGSIVGAGAQAGATAVGGVASAATVAGAGAAGAAASNASDTDNSGPMGYFIDSLFRKEASANAAPAADASAAAAPMAPAMPERGTREAGAEVSRIFLNSIRTGTLPPEDAKYVGQIVAQRTGLSQQDAEKRVNDTYAKAQSTLNEAKTKTKEAADTARKATAYGALWLVVSLLLGAFVASFAATYGGRRRDL